MQAKPIIEVEGMTLKNVYLTASGRKKVADAFRWHFRGGEAIENGANPEDDFFADEHYVSNVGTVEDWIFDIEHDALHGLQHPVCAMNGEEIVFEENRDYVIEMQFEEVLKLELLAQQLNELHDVMQTEMQRLGW